MFTLHMGLEGVLVSAGVLVNAKYSENGDIYNKKFTLIKYN